ncbi:MAG TPA: UDP-N-acetylmuramoyl-L-alanine--D-glutamate ligase, partial [Rhizobiales bacterium]|nr:UDP-N-acetylmuramoyl-L-alanine--D-glutamate ligase [Hyphomicrobiales bacterium]
MIAATKFAGKTVAVFGLGRTGLASIEALEKGGAIVWAWDDNEAATEKARSEGLPIVDLRDADFAELDSFVLSPGVPLTHPEPHWSVKKARAAGVEIIGDTEIFVRQIAGTGAKIVAITGTNGKSTTTALIGHVLNRCGLDAEIGGNIGTAVFLLNPPMPGKIYVLELSSYQLDLTPGLKADVAILMNLSPDHIDRHGSMEHYAEVKAGIFTGQDTGAMAVISVDDHWCRAIA